MFLFGKVVHGFPAMKLIANLGLVSREMNFQLHIERLHSFLLRRDVLDVSDRCVDKYNDPYGSKQII